MTNLSKKRKQLNLTQTAIAKLLSVTRQVYARRERTGIRTVSTARSYARKLGCRPEELLEF